MTTEFDARNFLATGGQGGKVLVYKEGAKIFKQGEEAEAVFYMQQGRAKETVISPGGKEAVLDIVEPGLFFGTGGLDGAKKRRSSVTAIGGPCVVTLIPQATMAKTLMAEPELVRIFLAYLLTRHSRIEAEKVDLLLSSTEQRLAQKLRDLSRIDVGPPQHIGPEINQELLAEMIGTTRSRLNYFLNRFRRMGLIKYNGGITVLPALTKVALTKVALKGGDNG